MSRGKGTRLEKSRRFSDQSQGRMLSNGLRVETFEEEGKKDKKKKKKKNLDTGTWKSRHVLLPILNPQKKKHPHTLSQNTVLAHTA